MSRGNEQNPEKIDVVSSFPGKAGIEVEIGSGKGMYVLDRARTCTDWGFLAIEIKSRLATLILDRASRRGLDNLTVARADARLLLPAMGPDHSVDRFVLNFPDPWWKKRQRKRAVVTPGLLDEIARLLRPGGTLVVQTDVFDRANDLLRLLTDDDRFENASAGGGFDEAPPGGAVSNRERVCRSAGLPVFRAVFRRAPPRGPVAGAPAGPR